MEDAKETEETPSRGNEWEVVTLTASTYAAAPGPDAFDSVNDERVNESNKDEEEASRAMFMSGHFVFPPNQHENLPIEPVDNEIHTEPEKEVAGANAIGLDIEGDESKKVIQENWDVKEMDVPENLDAKGKNLSGHDTEFGSGKALEELNVVEEEQTIYTAQKFSSLLGEADISESTVCEENLVIPEQNVSEENSSSDSSKSLSPKERKGYGLPCEAWWKRQAASLYAQAKEANAIWSVFVAAALMGLVILGQRWQQERWQSLQSNVSNEKVNRMMGPLSRFKDVIVGGHRQGSVLRGATSTER